MNLYNARATVIITCPKRLAPWLAMEVKDLGFIIEEVFVTGVRLIGSLDDCIRLNLSLRCASQVLYSLEQFEANHPDDIYNYLMKLPWEDIIPQPGYFSVTSNVNNPSIDNNLYANLRVKDAIVDRLRNKRGIRASTGSALTGAVIHLFWKNEQAEIFIDSSGDSLARHGYRKIPGRAPMLEALAAATIYASSWNRTSSFINPMCGSGTIAIEAALIATNRCPGSFRSNYAFMHLQGYNETVYLDERIALEKKIRDLPNTQIIATDLSSRAVDEARKNARAAGVEQLIRFAVADFAETEIPSEDPGVIFFNPEYGERMGEISKLEETYARIGDFMKKSCEGYFGYVFTGNLELAKKIGLKAKRRIEFYTSTIDCRLLEYELYKGSRSPSKEKNE